MRAILDRVATSEAIRNAEATYGDGLHRLGARADDLRARLTTADASVDREPLWVEGARLVEEAVLLLDGFGL